MKSEDHLPLEGRCNYRRDDGTFCRGRKVRGGTRCYQHGGVSQIASLRRRSLEAAGEAEVRAALADPSTMDPRAPIALSRVILERTPLEASDTEAYARARVSRMRAVGGELVSLWRHQIRALDSDDVETMLEALDIVLEPEAGDIEKAIRDIHAEGLKLVAQHSTVQVAAVKAVQWNDTIREVVHPFLTELGLSLSAFVREFVPEAKHRAALEKIAAITQRTLGLVSASSQKPNPVPGTNR